MNTQNLFRILGQNDLQTLEDYLQNDSHWVRNRNERGLTLVHQAIARKNHAAVQLLAENNKNSIDTPNRFGVTPLGTT